VFGLVYTPAKLFSADETPGAVGFELGHNGENMHFPRLDIALEHLFITLEKIGAV
jgi:hypothetical protein